MSADLCVFLRMCAERVAISISMNFVFFCGFFFPLFWSMAGVHLCQCLEALILHRIIKMPNSLKRDSNVSLEREKEKHYFFVFLPEMQGHK